MQNSAVAPFLARHAVPRTGDDRLPGEYSATRHIWISGGKPIVESGFSPLGLVTKTAAQTESDDETFERGLLEANTKTLAEREDDDQSDDIFLLALATKTDAVSEDDD